MAKLGRKGNELGSWLAKAGSAVFLLDSDRRIVAFNAGCERLTGWPAAEVLGTICHYGSPDEIAGPAALAASLCPPPEVFAGHELAAPAHLVHKDGRALPRMLNFFPLNGFPLNGADERLQGVLGIVTALKPSTAATDSSIARQLHAELGAVRMSLKQRFGPNSLVARCVAMRKVLAQTVLARQTSCFVLLEGESGVGKEHLARMIHLGGTNPQDWFVPLDCRRLGFDELERVWTRLLEVHRSGTSSGTIAQPGTIYLSDVECLPRDLQERLVAAFLPGEQPALPLRLIASTSCNLQQAVADDQVRADFLALVSPLVISVPPLRQRGDDLPLLAQHFLEEQNRHESRQIGSFDDALWPLFRHYDWPGNLDELQAVIREARAQTTDTLVRVADLPYRFRTALDAQDLPAPFEPPVLKLDPLLEKVERRLIQLALDRSRNNKSQAAEFLGIHRARILRRIEQLGLGSTLPTGGVPDPELDELASELMKDDSPEP
ncbi:MAG: hypothetical protein EXS05_03730 [Planctomycetaceae bacterium]|nr:hypothetical protein [Planctomycetaceae bacterium]